MAILPSQKVILHFTTQQVKTSLRYHCLAWQPHYTRKPRLIESHKSKVAVNSPGYLWWNNNQAGVKKWSLIQLMFFNLHTRFSPRADASKSPNLASAGLRILLSSCPSSLKLRFSQRQTSVTLLMILKVYMYINNDPVCTYLPPTSKKWRKIFQESGSPSL